MAFELQYEVTVTIDCSAHVFQNLILEVMEQNIEQNPLIGRIWYRVQVGRFGFGQLTTVDPCNQ